MPHVHGVVVGLGKTTGDRLSDAKKPIEGARTKEWVVNEVVTDAVDVGVHRQRVNQAQN